MVRSVGIVTIIDFANYGNRLQNFALQEVLTDMGVPVVQTICTTPSFHPGFGNVAYLRLKANRVGIRKALLEAMAAKTRRGGVSDGNAERNNLDNVEAEVDFFDGDLEDAAHAFDAFVVGSDQVWNPLYRFASDTDFLAFARPEQRIAYAASFGFENLPSWLSETYNRGLRGMQCISVREAEGASIVHSVSGREVPVVLDPALLIGANFWTSRTGVRNVVSNRLLSFGIDMSREDEARINKFAAARGLNPCVFDRRTAPSRSPLELVGAIMESEVVATNSFHAFAFAFMMGKPILVLPRQGMGSRFRAVLQAAGLSGSWSRNDAPYVVEPRSWSEAHARLEEARVVSRHYLQQALGLS